ncbi:MAG: hypothetical protein JWO67_3156 [Streptosporangiaceae bacterium]|nr:hypothetical protein [Streptosporangiaceae bacterium]
MKTIVNNPIVAALIGLVIGSGIKLALPWPAVKFIVGLAVITVVVCGALAYMRHESRKAAAAKAKAGAKHAS